MRLNCSAWPRVRTTAGSLPLATTDGRAKYLAAAVTWPWRSVSDQPRITAASPRVTGAGAGVLVAFGVVRFRRGSGVGDPLGPLGPLGPLDPQAAPPATRTATIGRARAARGGREGRRARRIPRCSHARGETHGARRARRLLVQRAAECSRRDRPA